MIEQTAAEMRNISNIFNEKDMSGWMEATLKDIKLRAEAGFYAAKIQVPAEPNNRKAFIMQLQRRGFVVTQVNPFVYTAQVEWS